MYEFTEEEQQVVLHHHTAEQQLRNLRRVMASSITPKKLKKLETVDLPQVIVKERNLRDKLNHLMKSHGYVPRG